MSGESFDTARLGACVRAGIAYALAALVAGFALGSVRVLFVVPLVGTTAAIALETPIMLTLSWVLSGWCTQHWRVPATVPARLLMGVVAFAVLMLEEMTVAEIFLGGRRASISRASAQ